MRSLSIRWRLTLWYGAVLSAILVGFSAAVYVMMRDHLLTLTDVALREEIGEIGDEVGRGGDIAKLPEHLRLQFPDYEGYELQVETLGGEPIFRSEGVKSGGLPSPAGRPAAVSGLSFESVTLSQLGPVRLASNVVPGPSGPLLVQAAVTLAPNVHALRELVVVLLTIGPLAVACTIGVGYWLARKALAPVDRMAATAAEITATRLDRRLAEPAADDELSHLARTFNAMIARLQRSFEEVRRFTADAAHELRTPLAAMRTEAEVALRSSRSPESDRRVLENLLEEIERLTRLVSHLLFLCREDTGVGVGEFQPVRLDEVVRDVGGHMRVAARAKGVDLVVDLPASSHVVGDVDRLRQLFFNLLDNAIKYTPTGGKVTVRGGPVNGQTHVIVADTGIGIPAEHLPHVFDRFYRVDPARSPETEGSGLGLAICRSIAEAHGGRVEIESILGSGTSVTLTLPIPKEHTLNGATHAEAEDRVPTTTRGAG